MFDWFYKTLPKNTFYVLLEVILHIEKTRNIYTCMIDFTFPIKMWLIKRGLGGQKGGCDKKV